MPITFRKALRDLSKRRLRSLLTVIGIIVGVAGIVAILTTSKNLTAAQGQAYNNSSQQDQGWSARDVPASVITALRAHPNVAAAERRADYFTKWSDGDTWRDLYFLGLEDFAHQEVNIIDLVEGRWPERGEVVFEKSIRDIVPLQVGDRISYRAGPNNETRQLTVTGFAQSPTYPAASIIGTGVAYAAASEVRRMYGGTGDSQIIIRLRDFDGRDATRKDIELLFDRHNLPHGGVRQRNPDNYPGKQALDALIMLMGVFSVVGLLISGFLVANTLAAVVSEQMGEIGAMKAVGATSGRILRIYLIAGLMYGLVGSAVGLVAGVAGSLALITYLGTLLNLDLSGFAPDPLALALGLAVGLGVTLVAAVIPAWRGTIIPVRAAIASYGISATYGQGSLDRLVQRLARLPRIPAMALRNLARRTARNVVTMLVVAFSTAAFLAAQGTSASVDTSFNAWFDIYDIDAFVSFQQPVGDGFATTLRSIPEIVAVDSWINTSATIGPTRTVLWGMPADTDLYRYHLSAGRWYAPGEVGVAVISEVLGQSRGYRIGDRFSLSLSNEETALTVIGIVADNINTLGSTAVGKVFVPRDVAARLLHRQGAADFFVIRLADRSPDGVAQTLATLERKYRSLQPVMETWQSNRNTALDQTAILSKLLYAMVIIVAVIGGIGIANTLTLNVLERRREIGVMRAIGARNGHLVQAFLTEALFIGGGGYLLGLVLGYPLAAGLVAALSAVLFQITFHFPAASVAWAGLFTLALTVLASVGPALGAARLRIGQTLRYE
ncbi:MAG TPA: FtsX-like permease family protein [Chloroflexia bacterium]|nr:FtsX-like permease family protein [Chloroflexia bacterium]